MSMHAATHASGPGRAVLAKLTEVLGEPEYGSSSPRWRVRRGASGAELRLELHDASGELWVFDPLGRGLLGAYSLDARPESLMSLEVEVRRLMGVGGVGGSHRR